MSEETPYWSVTLVLFIFLALIAGVFAWAFYFNFGELVVRADRNFRITVNGSEYQCEQECVVSLPPRSYELQASAEGLYPIARTVSITRWENSTEELSFEIIPYLQDIPEADIPEQLFQTHLLNRGDNDTFELVSLVSSRSEPIAVFESLTEPSMSCSLKLCAIVDEGRLFLVNLNERRRRRLFDDSVTVNEAKVSSSGNRALLFLESDGVDQVWLWNTETSEVKPTALTDASDKIIWQEGSDHQLFILSSSLVDNSQKSLLEDLIGSVTEAEDSNWSLFRYNLDTSEAQLLEDFEERVPLQILTRERRHFIEFEGAEWQELMLK